MIGSIRPVAQNDPRSAARLSGRVEPVASARRGGDQPALPMVIEEVAVIDDAAPLRAVVPSGEASSAFLAQLAALADGPSGERRVRRDVRPVLARADALYRDGYRRLTDIEPGFFGAAEY